MFQGFGDPAPVITARSQLRRHSWWFRSSEDLSDTSSTGQLEAPGDQNRSDIGRLRDASIATGSVSSQGPKGSAVVLRQHLPPRPTKRFRCNRCSGTWRLPKRKWKTDGLGPDLGEKVRRIIKTVNHLFVVFRLDSSAIRIPQILSFVMCCVSQVGVGEWAFCHLIINWSRSTQGQKTCTSFSRLVPVGNLRLSRWVNPSGVGDDGKETKRDEYLLGPWRETSRMFAFQIRINSPLAHVPWSVSQSHWLTHILSATGCARYAAHPSIFYGRELFYCFA